MAERRRIRKRDPRTLAERVYRVKDGVAWAQMRVYGSDRIVWVRVDADVLDDPEIGGARWGVALQPPRYGLPRLAGSYLVYRIVPAPTRSGQTSLLLHRLVARAPRGLVVDHRDGDRLNNTRANLRVCTNAENVRRKVSGAPRHNRSAGVLGVRRQSNGLYVPGIRIPSGQQLTGPRTADLQEALAWRVRMEREHFGEFAPVRTGTTG